MMTSEQKYVAAMGYEYRISDLKHAEDDELTRLSWKAEEKIYDILKTLKKLEVTENCKVTVKVEY